MDELLEALGLDYDQLNPEEKRVYSEWLDQYSSIGTVTTEDIKRYISALKSSVEQELANVDNGRNKDTFLKARLRNYLLLESFLESPEKARQAFKNQVKGLVNKQK